jgi:hypothetical protein
MTTYEAGHEGRRWSNPYVAGIVLGIVLFAAYFVTGHGLGASGGIQRIVVWLEDLVAPGHVDRTAHLAGYAGGDVNPLASYIIPIIAGIPLGGFVSAWRSGRLAVLTGKGPNISVRRRWLFALLGGIVMGFGAQVARGCTSGLALSGGAVLSVGAWAFMLAFFGGGYAFASFARKLWN